MPPDASEHVELHEGAAEADAGGEFVPRQVLDRHARAERAARAVHARDRDLGGAVQRLVEHRVLRRGHRIDAFLGQHRVGLAHAQRLEELLRHLHQEHVQADQRVLGKAIARGKIEVFGSDVCSACGKFVYSWIEAILLR